MAVSASADVASALWYRGRGQVEIRREAIAPPGTGEIRVKTLYSAISRGTESLVLGGRIPVGEYERMRAPFMAGNFPFPVKYGYAAVDGSRTAAMTCETRPSLRFIRIRPHSTSLQAQPWRFPSKCRRSARCWRPIWKPPSTACGTPRRDRPTASPSSEPAWSAPLSPICAGGCRYGRYAGRHQRRPSGIGSEARGWFRRARIAQRPIAISSFTPAARPMGCGRRSNWPETRRLCLK